MPKPTHNLGAMTAGTASKHALQMCWQGHHISLSYLKQKYQNTQSNTGNS